MRMSLWTKKPLGILMQEAGEEGEHTLKRSLSALNLTLLGIGAIIGAGIFVLTGQAAAQYAGPAIVLSFVIAGFGCLFAGLCYAEFASMIPIAGSAYTYGYATLGELLAWIIGWDLILEYLFAASTVSVGWSGYFVELMKEIGFAIPEKFAGAPLKWVEAHRAFEATASVVNLPAMVLIALLTGLLVVGIRESARFNNIAVFIKLAIVLLVIGFGFMYVNTANWHPFIPENTGTFGHYGWTGVVRGSAVVFFAYIGFDAVSTAAQEAKNPQRDLPIGILASLAICTVLYILMALVMTGLVPFMKLDVPHPVFVAIDAAGPALKWLTYFINIGAIAGLSSVVLVMLMGQPRIFFAMARDGLLPPVFGKVHPKFQTPWLATIITGGFAMIFGGLFPIDILGELVSIGTLLAFVIVCAGVLVLRYRSPELHRPFKTPMVPLVPILGIGVCGFMMSFLPSTTWLRLIIWMAIGLAIYFFYGRHHSRLGRAEA
ncbi:MAG: amino acid permease [Gemmatimonadetes bacterium]|nr:amino acid permease [Gemmatimonadota bacterium]MBI3566662.1 amino acid permease [Gemmatimonadota bacterium]